MDNLLGIPCRYWPYVICQEHNCRDCNIRKEYEQTKLDADIHRNTVVST
uniref:Uncharacterized protein n=1 Tax=viral metagenome TaxID=1070528 RepID=A0A6M3K5K1_9ZZZZ